MKYSYHRVILYKYHPYHITFLTMPTRKFRPKSYHKKANKKVNNNANDNKSKK